MRVRALLLIAASLVPAHVFGQGGMSGIVTDSGSKPLPGVTVTVTDVTADPSVSRGFTLPTRTGSQRSIVTDASGRYEIGNVCPGSYVVTFRLQGFRSVLRRDVAVRSGTTVNLFEALRAGTGLEPVTTYMSVRGFQGADTSPIVAERIVPAPLTDVWAAWTTSDGLRSWLAPHASIDLRVGGLMRTNYNAQGTLGDAQTIENAILSFEPERMLSIRVAKAPANTPFPNTIGEMWTVLYFEAVGVDRTKVRVVGQGFTQAAESWRMREFFKRGNVTTLDQLERHFLSCTP